MTKPCRQCPTQQSVVIHRFQPHQRTRQLIGLPAAAQAVQQYWQHQILIEIATAFRHPLFTDHHGSARRTIRTGNATRPGKIVAQRHAKTQLSVLFHAGNKLLNALAMIFSVPAAKLIERRFQHHHLGQRDNRNQIITFGRGQRILQLL